MKKPLLFKCFLALLAVGTISFQTHAETALNVTNSTEMLDQKVDVAVTVKDAQGMEVIGAMVVCVENPAKAAITGVDGTATISGVPADASLTVSILGYKDQTVVINNRSAIIIVLEDDAIAVDEVVVVGFGSQKKVNLTGSVAVTDAETFEARPVQNAVQALQGVVPGLQISQTSGSLDTESSINIRGMATIGEGSDGSPLVLIDGMEGDLNTINPQDIETISVLKDAASSSIYGSRAPFGVILVTTKSGKEGKAKVNYNNSFRFSSLMNVTQTMDSWSFANFYNDALTNVGSAAYFGDEQLTRIWQYQQGEISTVSMANSNGNGYWGDYGYCNANTDWFDEIYADWTFSQEHNLSISGGNEKQQYYASVNYLTQDGFMNFGDDGYNRFTSTLKINSKVYDFLDFKYSMRFTRDNYYQPTSMDYSSLYQNLGRQAWPTLPVYDDNGYLFSAPSPALLLQDGGTTTNATDQLYQQASFVAKPLKGWNITAELNYRIDNDRNHYDKQTVYNHDVNGDPYAYANKTTEVYEYQQGANYLNTNIFSDYTFNINNDHEFKVMGGFQAERYTNNNFSASRNGVVVSYMDVLDATNGLDTNGSTVAPSVSGETNEWTTAGFFGRLNYNYKDRYMVEANLRYDGTSRYRVDQRWNWFPSFSAGWNIAKEDFWEGMTSKISMLKLRASYGTLGNQNTTNWYPTYSTMNVGAADGTWLVNTANPNTATYPDLISSSLTWETISTLNIGLDFAALNNRLTGTVEWYDRRTNNMVGPAPELPATLGADEPYENNTDLKTAGWELSLKWNDRTASGFGYSIGLQLSDSKTTIMSYPNETNLISLTSTTGATSNYYNGETVGDIYGYTTIGIAKTQSEMDAHLATLSDGGQSALGTAWAAGDIMYKDINGDGKIDTGSMTVGDTGDLSIIGNNQARYLFGIDLSADYKGFDFRAFFQGVLKRDYMVNNATFWGIHSSGGMWWSNGFEGQQDYFRDDASHPLGENLDSYYPRPLLSSTKNYNSQTGYIQDASYIRLKNLQIGYTFDQSKISKLGISYLRVFVSGENLWTCTSLADYFDPETISSGYNGVTYPLQTTISCGLNITF